MPLELVDMETATPFDRLRLVLVGGEKTGKSRLAATGRKGVLVFDWDGRRQSLAGMKGVKAITLIDPGIVTAQPTAFNDGLGYLTKLEMKQTFSNLGFKDVAPEKDAIKTVVLDSIFSMARAARNVALFTAQDLRRTLQIGSMTVRLPSGWDAWNAEIALVEQFIFRLLAITSLDVILIFHEEDEEAPGSSVEKRLYTGRFEPYPARYGNVLKYFNELWRITRRDANAPKIQFVPDYTFQAATNLGIASSPTANIEELINNYLNGNKIPPADAGVMTVQSGKIEVAPIKGVV